MTKKEVAKEIRQAVNKFISHLPECGIRGVNIGNDEFQQVSDSSEQGEVHYIDFAVELETIGEEVSNVYEVHGAGDARNG